MIKVILLLSFLKFSIYLQNIYLFESSVFIETWGGLSHRYFCFIVLPFIINYLNHYSFEIKISWQKWWERCHFNWKLLLCSMSLLLQSISFFSRKFGSLCSDLFFIQWYSCTLKYYLLCLLTYFVCSSVTLRLLFYLNICSLTLFILCKISWL